MAVGLGQPALQKEQSLDENGLTKRVCERINATCTKSEVTVDGTTHQKSNEGTQEPEEKKANDGANEFKQDNPKKDEEAQIIDVFTGFV